jgi:hypothetical protein
MRRSAALGLAGLAALVVALQAWVSSERLRWREAPPPRPGATAPDRCTNCHAGVEGLEASHASLGCADCHLGDRSAGGALEAHQGLVSLPGNLDDADRTCGRAGCHPELPARLRGNIMSTMNGVVSVDRWVFGEQPTPTAVTPVDSLGRSPADSHLRNLCASCHLGAVRREAGPLDELTRGGGCSACHLRYSARAAAAVGTWRDAGAPPFVHAALSVRPEPVACFGCHSRSGRISLNYQGWQEGPGDAGAAAARTLDDGRVVHRGPADVHAERGLGCVDCHGALEVMGGGRAALHREDQAFLGCADCHLRADRARTAALEQLDPQSARVATLEGLARPGRRYLQPAGGATALVNAFVEDGGLALVGKYSGRRYALRAPASACGDGPAHRALACQTCHDAWAPRCVSCHTEYQPDAGAYDLLAGAEVQGAWRETGEAARADLPSLGVRLSEDGGVRRVEEFVPGMVLTLVRGPAERARPRFSRLFAPSFPHTVRREARTCAQCHRDPLALGYGRGELTLEVQAGRARWRFTPAQPRRAEDGRPADAWIGFLEERGADSTTREDTRPFTLAEQRRLLTVGACLTCHDGDSGPMRRGLQGFAAVLARRSARCLTLRWR